MRCGGQAHARVPQRFAWMPGWVHIFILFGLLPWLVLALVTRRTMRVAAPMCRKHMNHWFRRKLYIWIGLIWWIGVAIVLLANTDELPANVVTPIVAASLLGALLWLIVGLILAQGAIRAAQIRESAIELANVNKEFALAWRVTCEEDDERPRPKMRRRSGPSRPRAPWNRGARSDGRPAD
jgi:hypothetical protein